MYHCVCTPHVLYGGCMHTQSKSCASKLQRRDFTDRILILLAFILFLVIVACVRMRKARLPCSAFFSRRQWMVETSTGLMEQVHLERPCPGIMDRTCHEVALRSLLLHH